MQMSQSRCQGVTECGELQDRGSQPLYSGAGGRASATLGNCHFFTPSTSTGGWPTGWVARPDRGQQFRSTSTSLSFCQQSNCFVSAGKGPTCVA